LITCSLVARDETFPLPARFIISFIKEALMINVRKIGLVSAIVLTMLLSACGGMSSGGPSEIPPPGPKPMM
jgi:hypothetical protein